MHTVKNDALAETQGPHDCGRVAALLACAPKSPSYVLLLAGEL